MYAYAEQYDIPGLQHLAATEFFDTLKAVKQTDSFPISLDVMREIYTTTPTRARHLRDIAMAAFQHDRARHSLLHSKTFIEITDAAPEAWKDFPQAALGLVRTEWGPHWVLRDDERDRMAEMLKDVPPRWRPLVRHPLLTDRESTTGRLALEEMRSHFEGKLDQPPNHDKRTVRALFGLQCDSKTYRCDGYGGAFD